MSYIGIDLGWTATSIVRVQAVKSGGVKVVQKLYNITDKKVTGNAKQKLFLQKYYATGQLWELLEKPITLICIEKPFNIAGTGRALIELLGIVKCKLYELDIPFLEVAQMTLKKFATGTGTAKKSDMAVSAWKKHKFEGSEDEVDAFWLAMLGLCIHNPLPSLFNKEQIKFIQTKKRGK